MWIMDIYVWMEEEDVTKIKIIFFMGSYGAIW